MVVNEFQPQNPGVFADGLFVTEPVETLSRLEFVTHPIPASTVRQVQVLE